MPIVNQRSVDGQFGHLILCLRIIPPDSIDLRAERVLQCFRTTKSGLSWWRNPVLSTNVKGGELHINKESNNRRMLEEAFQDNRTEKLKAETNLTPDEVADTELIECKCRLLEWHDLGVSHDHIALHSSTAKILTELSDPEEFFRVDPHRVSADSSHERIHSNMDRISVSQLLLVLRHERMIHGHGGPFKSKM